MHQLLALLPGIYFSSILLIMGRSGSHSQQSALGQHQMIGEQWVPPLHPLINGNYRNPTNTSSIELYTKFYIINSSHTSNLYIHVLSITIFYL